MVSEGKMTERLMEEMALMCQCITEFGNSGSQAELVKEPIEKNIAFSHVVMSFLPNPFYAMVT